MVTRITVKKASGLAFLGVAMALAGCAGAQSPVHSIAVAAGAAHADPKPQGFVTETRPSELKYIPVGTSVRREQRKLTPAEFAALEAELNARKAQDVASGAAVKQLGATPPPAPPKVN